MQIYTHNIHKFNTIVVFSTPLLWKNKYFCDRFNQTTYKDMKNYGNSNVCPMKSKIIGYLAIVVWNNHHKILNIDFCFSRLSLFPSERNWYWKRQYTTHGKYNLDLVASLNNRYSPSMVFLMWLDCRMGFPTMRMKRVSLKFQTACIYWIFTVW